MPEPIEEPSQQPSTPSTEMTTSPADAGGGAEQISQPPPPLIRQVFIGPDGLRAGWRLAIYIAVFLALVMGISSMLRKLVPPSHGHAPRLWAFLVGECIQLVCAVVPAIVLARFERRPFGAYGLPREGAFGKRFWVGALWGIVAFSVLIFVMRAIGVVSFGGLALHGARVIKFAAFWALLFLLVGLFEEFTTRGYTQFTLAQGIGFWPAAAVLSFAFGALHFPQEYALGSKWAAWAGALAAASIGLFFCLTLRRLGALWFAVGMHMSWDWSETYLYSVPDSGVVAPGHLLNTTFHGPVWLTGGAVGPEASVLVFVVIALLAVAFHRAYPARKAEQPALAGELQNQ